MVLLCSMTTCCEEFCKWDGVLREALGLHKST